MFSLLVGLLGIGVDLGRVYLYRAQLSGALDAAALAGAKSFHSDSRDAEIQEFFSNFFYGHSRIMGQITRPAKDVGMWIVAFIAKIKHQIQKAGGP